MPDQGRYQFGKGAKVDPEVGAYSRMEHQMSLTALARSVLPAQKGDVV